MSKIWKVVIAVLGLAVLAWLSMRDRPGRSQRVNTDAEQPAVEEETAAASPKTTEGSAPRSPGVDQSLEASNTRTPIADGARTAEASAEVPLRVVLVDDETGEPVPHLVAELFAVETVLERMASDERGLLTSRGVFEPRAYRLDLSSERAPKDLIQSKRKAEAREFPTGVALVLAPRDAALPPAELSIPIGPTIEFVAVWPGALKPSDFLVQLGSADPRQAWDKLYADVRDGSPPWARFSPLTRFMAGGPPWGVRVTSEDGLWFASATVESLDKQSLVPVRLDFTPRGRIVGRLTTPDSAPLARQWVQAWLPDSSFDNPTKRPVLVLTDEQGRFDLRALEPGTYTLRVEAEGCDPLAEDVAVPALATVEHDVQLTQPDPESLGSIRVRITSLSGTYAGPVGIRIRQNFPPYSSHVEEAAWKKDAGVLQATCEFADLVAGEYTITAIPKELVAVLPRTIDAVPGADVIELSIDDLARRVDVPVRVVADEDGSPLSGFRVDVKLRDRDAQVIAQAGKDETAATIRGAPVGATLELVAYADGGRQILWQDVVVSNSTEKLVLRVKKGYGALVVVRGPDDKRLEGTRVFFDDELIGSTDANGELRVAVEKAPTVVRAEYRDWVLAAGGDVLHDTGRIRTEAATVRVRMEPAK